MLIQVREERTAAYSCDGSSILDHRLLRAFKVRPSATFSVPNLARK
jgi:hypothetical protein